MYYTIIGVYSISKMKHQGLIWRTMGLWVAIHYHLADPGFADVIWNDGQDLNFEDWVVIRAGELGEDKVDDQDKD